MHLKKLLLFLLVALTSVSMYADNAFTQNRTDFRDESIYFLMTTRFYDGDPTNNVLCWDAQANQIANGDPCWRGDFAGVIDKLDYSNVTTAIAAPAVNVAGQRIVIYSISGERVATVSDIREAEYLLRSGIYVVNGRKFIVK